MGNFWSFVNDVASRLVGVGLRLYAVYDNDPLLNVAPYGNCDTGPDALEWLEIKRGAIVNQTCMAYDHYERCWYTYVSERARERRNNVPLIVDLHGVGGCASLPAVGWGTIADNAGLVVAWPQATKHDITTVPGIVTGILPDFILDLLGLRVTSWNDGTGLFGAEEAGIDDVGFLQAMLLDIVQTVPTVANVRINANRIYMMGHSNGGTMAQRFALQTVGILAGVVAISGSGMPHDPMWSPGGDVGVNYQPTPIALVAGSKDGVVPFDERLGPLAGAMASFDGWGRVNGCTPESRTVTDKFGYTEYIYTDCAGSTEVSLFRIAGDGHHPFVKGLPPFQIASVNTIANCPFRGIPWFSECDCVLSNTDSAFLAWEFIARFR